MRIISGTYKSRKITTDPKASFRPTSARVRKSLFDLLGPVSGLSILDLFAGSGILGFEAMSRGGSKLSSVEMNTKYVKLIRQNAVELGVECDVIKIDAFTYLKTCPQFDIIFADPPYGDTDLQLLLELCLNKLHKGGRLVIESSKHDLELDGGKVKEYGDTRLTIFTHE